MMRTSHALLRARSPRKIRCRTVTHLPSRRGSTVRNGAATTRLTHSRARVIGAIRAPRRSMVLDSRLGFFSDARFVF